MLSQLLILISSPLVYWYYSDKCPTSKLSSIVTLIFAAFLQLPSDYARNVAITMTFCAIGDVFIELDGSPGPDWFLFGLLAFFVAHIGFIASFYTKLTFLRTLVLGGICGGYYYYIISRLYNGLPEDMKIPVLLYGVIISGMGFFAVNRLFAGHISLTSRLCVLIGAFFFILSDTLLAINRFEARFANGDFIVFVTYYIAQVFVVISAITYKEDEKVVNASGKKTKGK